MRRAGLVVLLAAALAASCSGAPPDPRGPEDLPALVRATKPTGLKVLLVGIDGASFSVLDPLVAAGKAPVLAGLMKAGARAPLKSDPPMLSAALWTTVVTGQDRNTHGITDFSVTEGSGPNERVRMVGSTDRRKLALWNITGPFGLKSGFVGWWASWPAEPVEGWMVSDRVARERFTEWLKADRQEHLTWPEGLAGTLSPLVVDPMAPPMDEIDALADMTAAERAEFLAVAQPIRAHWASVLKFAYCSQRSYENIALHLIQRGQPDLMGVFLIATDPASHTTWHFYDPGSFPLGSVDAGQAARLGTIIPRLYEHDDRFLGELLRHADAHTVVIVVSDHGFRASRHLPIDEPAAKYAASFESRREEAMREGTVAVGQSGKHHVDGIFIASGGPIRPGATCEASLFDVLPTVLALLGLPVPSDVRGRVLEDIFDPAFLREHPVRRIPSYEPLIERAAAPAAKPADDTQAMEMLRSLGYAQ